MTEPTLPLTATPVKVLIVDDHDIVRLGVRHLLGPRFALSEAASLNHARAWLATQRCDVLLLDLGLGDEFGLTALAPLRQAWPAMKIIVFTSMAEELYAERALRAGADGFVMKSAMGQTLLQALDQVLAGEVYVSPKLGGTLLRRMAGYNAQGQRPELSAREVEVLHLVAAGKSTRDIAEQLNRSVKTIETHKQALKTKLGADSPAQLIRVAMAWAGDRP